MSAIIRAYLPEGTNPEAIINLMLGHGGFTIYHGFGCWVAGSGDPGDPLRQVKERVVVYECVTDGDNLAASADAHVTAVEHQLKHAGRVYLNDNRNEKAFLGVVIGTHVRQIYIEQERA